MQENWDKDYNPNSLTAEQQEKEQQKEWERELQENNRRRDEARRAAGYRDMPFIPDEIIRRDFPRWIDYEGDANHGWPIATWGANRLIYICHNCGCFGYKQSNQVRATFKCYGCHSRNITICRSGELSIVVRDNQLIGRNMQDIYNEYRAERRANRRSRSSR